jgi:hypothetical protein
MQNGSIVKCIVMQYVITSTSFLALAYFDKNRSDCLWALPTALRCTLARGARMNPLLLCLKTRVKYRA